MGVLKSERQLFKNSPIYDPIYLERRLGGVLLILVSKTVIDYMIDDRCGI